MKDIIKDLFQESIDVKQKTLQKNLDAIVTAGHMMSRAIKAGGKILIFGNGGSAADSQHMAAELIGRFQKERQALAAIALTTDSSILTCLGNDYGYDTIFSRQVEALIKPGDVALGISTSGRSPNVIKAIETAKNFNAGTVALCGAQGGPLAEMVDCSIVVPSEKTARIQESHLCIEHILCQIIEDSCSE
jgi:D-sedoheptulose 7-phosphate isomerase